MRPTLLALLTSALLLSSAWAAPKTISATAQDSDGFRTLTAALKQAGLVDALAGKGPFTVFAPTDAAFAKLPPEVLADLLKPENRGRLTAILTYHVVPGRVTAGEALLAKKAKSLQGAELTFGFSDGALRVGPAAIIRPDIAASNGVIHVIDQVLLPPTPAETKRDGIEALLTLAIERGAPQFNAGNIAACTAIYEVAARAIVALGSDAITPEARRDFETTLADSDSDDRSRAWAFRRTFDVILGDVPAPKKTASTFKPLIEAALPAGFPAPGPVGEVVLKTYPTYRMARAKGGMFAFGTLFNHIKKNEIAMTAPVEMTMDEKDGGLAQRDMAFLYASTELGKTGEQGRVEVVDVKDARVLSFGIRGPMSQAKIAEAKAAIEARLGTQWKRAGEWRMMGYNSPMVPAARRFWEIQLPVQPVSSS